MKLKNVTLATALLAVLTGCGSSGGGSNNSAPNAEINNNQATQAQIEQQKAEVEKLKQQLSQAQNTQKQALEATENSSKADVATAQKNLADAQAKLANIQQNLSQAEKNLAENKTNQAALQKQLTQAQQAVEQAKLAKENSEKALNQQLQSKENDVAQAKKSLENANVQLSTAQENLNKLQNRLDNLPTNQKEFDKQITKAQKALEDAKQAKLDAETNLNKQLADRNADLAKVQENLTASNNKLAQAEKELKVAQVSIQQSNADKTSLETQLNTAKQNLQAAKQEQAKAQESFNQQLAGKEANLAKAQQDLTASNNKLAQAEKELKAAQASIQQSNADKTSLETQLNTAKQNLQAAKQEQAKAQESFNQQLAGKEANLAKAQQDLTSSNNKLAQAEKELKAAQASAQQINSDKSLIETQLNQAKKDLEAAQKSKEEAEKTLKDQLAEKGQLLNTAQKEKNDAYDKLQAALDAKQKAEKALADKNALEQPLDKARTLEFALNGGLNNEDADEFAKRYQGKSKSELQDILNGWHKHIRLLDLARDQAINFGLYSTEEREKFAHEFAKKNKDKTIDEAYEILNKKLKQHNAELEKEREEQEKQIAALANIAKTQGLSEDDARIFANNNPNLSPDEFKNQLQAKTTELVNQAKAFGLDEEIANKFARENINNSGYTLESNLNKLKVDLFTNLANNSSLSGNNARSLINMNGNTALSTNDFKKLLKASELIMKGNESSYLSDEKVEFIKRYLNLSDAEIANKVQKRNEFENLLSEYYGDSMFSDSDRETFINKNAEKNKEEQIIAIANIYKKNIFYVDEDTPVDKIINTPVSSSKIGNTHHEYDSKLYNQKYSVVKIGHSKTIHDGFDSNNIEERIDLQNGGLQTKENSLPIEGKATYTGKAFNYGNNGDLIYNVDFSSRKGSGKITGFDEFGTITLEEAPLQVRQISKTVGIQGGVVYEKQVFSGYTGYEDKRGGYGVDFYGPNAEEIGGSIGLHYHYSENSRSQIGFGGTRGEIQK